MAGRRSGRRFWRPRPASHSTSGQRHSCTGAESQPLRTQVLWHPQVLWHTQVLWHPLLMETHAVTLCSSACKDVASKSLLDLRMGRRMPLRSAHSSKSSYLCAGGGGAGHGGPWLKHRNEDRQDLHAAIFHSSIEKLCSCPSRGQGPGVQGHGWRCETRRGRRLPAARAATPQASSCMPALPGDALRLSRLR